MQALLLHKEKVDNVHALAASYANVSDYLIVRVLPASVGLFGLRWNMGLVFINNRLYG
jgi:hypothetical protein